MKELKNFGGKDRTVSEYKDEENSGDDTEKTDISEEKTDKPENN